MIRGDLIEAVLQVLAIGNIFIEQSQDFTFPRDWMFGSLMTVNNLTASIDQEIGEVPWQANLLYPSKYYTSYHVRIRDQSYYKFCGGVIISNTKVISAAHCIMSFDEINGITIKSLDKIQVIAGHSSIRTARQISELAKFTLHP